MRICESFFSLGVKTVIALNLWPPDIIRREDQFMQLTLKMSRIALLHPELVTLAQRWQAALRLHSDYDVTATGEPLREGLNALNDELKQLTPEQDRLLLFGFYTGQYEDEMIARTLHLYHQLQRPPTAEELHRSAFPDGPHHIDIYINGGWMSADNWSIPPLLNQQSIAMYILAHLVLDLQAVTMRRLLYDCLFVRRKVSLTDNLSYTGDPLQQLSDYYQQHAYCFVGSGELVGPDLWYPEHVHRTATSKP